MQGLDTVQPLPGGSPLTAVRLENIIPRAFGCALRPGYLRHVSNMGQEIRSLMSYFPALGDPKLFAASSNGDVYDVTDAQLSSFTPTAAMTTTGAFNGEFTSLNFVSSAGIHYLVIVGPDLGYWTFDGTTWVEHVLGVGVGEITPVNPRDFAYVTVYKGSLVFVEENSTSAWYLPFGQIAGTATEFDFGAMFPHGGKLEVVLNWTYDGGGGTTGIGMDNKLVMVSDQGDVLVYSGEDINVAGDFHVEGRWYIGRVPPGRRFSALYATDLALLSERGLCFMSELMRGQGFLENVGLARKINSELSALVQARIDAKYWEVVFLPSEQLIVINVPDFTRTYIQFAYEVNNKAWCTLRRIPALTIYAFNGNTYCGDYDGNVWQCFEGQSDGAIDDVPGTDLTGICVTAFQPMGDGVRVKRFLMVRPSFLSNSTPGVMAELNSEWDLTGPSAAPPFLSAGESLWDVGSWDVAVWSGTGRSYEYWMGATGFGRYAALSLQVRGAANTVFVGWQALVEQGGVL
jgi:hypothetical protein